MGLDSEVNEAASCVRKGSLIRSRLRSGYLRRCLKSRDARGGGSGRSGRTVFEVVREVVVLVG